jgi:hypothetical protein
MTRVRGIQSTLTLMAEGLLIPHFFASTIMRQNKKLILL